MTSDVTSRCVRCLQARGRGPVDGRAMRPSRGEGGRLIIGGGLPDLWSVIAMALGAHRDEAIVRGLGPERLDLDVWLIPPSPR